MLPVISVVICSSLGFGVFANNAAACMICPDWQYPHCGTCSAIQASCSLATIALCSPCCPATSIVVMVLPCAFSHDVEHERTALPSRCTVQQPHSATPQPNFVPVSPTTSRMAHNSGISGATSSS